MDRPTKLTVSPGFFLQLAVMILLFPLEWVLAMLIAGAVHELGHAIALRFFRIRIRSLSIKAAGANMETEPMTGCQEIFAALSGPMAGFLMIIFAKWMPRVAFCSFIHGLYNLLPIYPSDGGRILSRTVYALLPAKAAGVTCDLIKWGMCAAVFVTGIWFSVMLRIGVIALIPGLILLVKTVRSQGTLLDKSAGCDKLFSNTK